MDLHYADRQNIKGSHPEHCARFPDEYGSSAIAKAFFRRILQVDG